MIGQVKKTLYDVMAGLTGGETVIWKHPNAPRPSLPYWTIKVMSVTRLGMPTAAGSVTTDDAGETVMRHSFVREGTLEIERLGADSVDRVGALSDRLFTSGVVAQLKAARIAVWDVQPVQDITALLDANLYEFRASVDAMIRFGVGIDEPLDWIETVVATEQDGD